VPLFTSKEKHKFLCIFFVTSKQTSSLISLILEEARVYSDVLMYVCVCVLTCQFTG
jgi:hypothetical protein